MVFVVDASVEIRWFVEEALSQEAVSLKKLHTWAKEEGKLQLAPFAEYWTQHQHSQGKVAKFV